MSIAATRFGHTEGRVGVVYGKEGEKVWTRSKILLQGKGGKKFCGLVTTSRYNLLRLYLNVEQV